MLPDRVSNPGPLTYESGALPIALRGPAIRVKEIRVYDHCLASRRTLVFQHHYSFSTFTNILHMTDSLLVLNPYVGSVHSKVHCYD